MDLYPSKFIYGWKMFGKNQTTNPDKTEIRKKIKIKSKSEK